MRNQEHSLNVLIAENKRFNEFAEPVLGKDGKPLREKTAVGKGIFKKKDIVKAKINDKLPKNKYFEISFYALHSFRIQSFFTYLYFRRS